MKSTNINGDIISDRVLLIDADGTKRGVFQTRTALDMALEAGLDLVQVSQDDKSPVCKIMDYGKFLYEQKKRQKDGRQTKTQVKEVRLGATTEKNDVEVKIKAANKFLSKGHKVRFLIRVKGRDNAHKDLVIAKLRDILEEVEGGVEVAPSFSGNICSALVVPE